jgi:hypothetical protein
VDRTSPKGKIDLAGKLNVEIITEDAKKNITTLFEGTMADLISHPVATSLNANSNQISYNITVSLPDDTGNDYQAQNFKGDFKWSISDKLPVANPKTGSSDGALKIFSFCLVLSAALIFLSRKSLLPLVEKIKAYLK